MTEKPSPFDWGTCGVCGQYELVKREGNLLVCIECVNEERLPDFLLHVQAHELASHVAYVETRHGAGAPSGRAHFKIALVRQVAEYAERVSTAGREADACEGKMWL